MQSLKRENGFTLMEVLVAVTILSIVTAAFVTLFSSSFQGIYSMGHRTEAMLKVQKHMEIVLEIAKQSSDYADFDGQVEVMTLPEGMEITRSPKTMAMQGPTDDIPGASVTIVYEYSDTLGKTAAVSMTSFAPI